MFKMENQNNINVLPKSREDFGYRLDTVIEKVLLRVKEKYPKKKIDELFLNRKKQEAHDLLAKEFGKFLAEVTHIAYEPKSLAFASESVNKRQDRLHSQFLRRKDYAKAFIKEYNIKVNEHDLLVITKFMENTGGNIENPQLISDFEYLIEHESCPLPKQILAKLLEKNLDEIPAGYKIDNIHGRPIIKRKKAVERVSTMQLTENGEDQENKSKPKATSSSNNYELSDNVAEGAFIGTLSTGVVSLGASAIGLALENVEKTENHKVSIVLASIGTTFLGICTSISCFASKIKSKKPSTQIKTHILDKEYILDPETFLGIRVLIVDGEKDITDKDAIMEYERAKIVFYHLKDAIDGTHERLPVMLKSPRDKQLYVTIARSFIETYYEIICEFPEIIEEMRGYRENVRDDRDIDSHSRAAMYSLGQTRINAEFVRY
jgi:hypothetical protein